MKQLLLGNPINLLLIFICGIVYVLIMFQFVCKNKHFGWVLEKIVTCLYLFIIPGVAMAPFPVFEPVVLANREKSLPSLIVQLGVYATLVFILSPRLKQTLKGSLEFVALVIQNNPFFCIFLLLLSLSFAWSETPVHTLKYSLVFLLTTVVSAYILKQNNYQQIAAQMRLTIGLSALMSTYYNQFRQSLAFSPAKGSWQGIFSHPNSYGAMMAMGATLWLVQVFDNPKHRWFSIGMVLFMLYNMDKAESGAAKVQFILAIMIVASIRFLKQLPFQWAFFFIVMFMVISIAGMIVVMDNLEAIVVDGLNKDLTLTGRTPLWEFLFQNKISQRPVLGYGIAGFWQRWRAGDNPAANTLDGRLEMPSGDGYWNPPHSHNGFIEIIIAVGFVGFFFFAISFLIAVANAIRYLAIPQPPGTGIIESALPLIFLFFVLLPNITEIPLIENNHSWYYYIATAVGLCIKNSPKNLRVEPTETKPILPQKIPL